MTKRYRKVKCLHSNVNSFLEWFHIFLYPRCLTPIFYVWCWIIDSILKVQLFIHLCTLTIQISFREKFLVWDRKIKLIQWVPSLTKCSFTLHQIDFTFFFYIKMSQLQYIHNGYEWKRRCFFLFELMDIYL